MKIVINNKPGIFLHLDWTDLDKLKKGEMIAERYDGEHKINIGVIPETLVLENWTDGAKYRDQIRFDTYLHELIISLSIYTVRCQFVGLRDFNLTSLPIGKEYKEATIFFPE